MPLLSWAHGSRVSPFLRGINFFEALRFDTTPVKNSHATALLCGHIESCWVLNPTILVSAEWPAPAESQGSNRGALSQCLSAEDDMACKATGIGSL